MWAFRCFLVVVLSLDVCFAYSGDVFSITIEGEMVFVLAYSGGDGAVFSLIWIFFRLTAGWFSL